MPSAVTPGDKMVHIKASLRKIPDFPKPGIMFVDVTTLLLDPTAFQYVTDLFVARYKDLNVNVVAGGYSLLAVPRRCGVASTAAAAACLPSAPDVLSRGVPVSWCTRFGVM